MERTILPCPECGGVGKIVYVGDRKLYPIVRCSNCGHEESRFHAVTLSENWAIDIWNERVTVKMENPTNWNQADLERAIASLSEQIQDLSKEIRSLSKQVPQKPKSEKYFYGNIYSCPRCGVYIDKEPNKNHCSRCGQALDWGGCNDEIF